MCAAVTETGQSRTGTPHVVVVGGGIAGLAAAHRALGAGARVTVLEASPRLGGKLHAGEIEGVRVDLGAESMLARRPEAVDLAREVGLGELLQPPGTATAALWTRGELRPMPKGHVMGVPGDAAALAGVVSAEGLRRIAEDSELPATEVGEDIAVGRYVADRLGREVVDRLVEPLLGGVYAGDAYRISMRAAVPQLFEVARTHRSLTEGVRDIQARAGKQQGAVPVFMGIEGGIGRLPLAVADSVRARGGDILTGAAVTELRRTGAGQNGAGWRIVAGESVFEADAVVIALPAPHAARLLAAESPAAAAELTAVEYASMALVTLAYRTEDAATLPSGSGFLVPPVDGHTIKAATFSANKWGWSAAENRGLRVLRTSIGRYGDEDDLSRADDDLIRVARGDLRAATGLDALPVAARVTRWDQGLPQYPVGHQARVARVRRYVGALPGLAVCGAAYDGVGIPACVASAAAAVDLVVGRGPASSTADGARE
ncbi:protoporphyrinogen oxidase [Streptomyces tsukubensis]|uniref:Coproporphyrinogen III oxidase n=1 Tax=Streptomyces tsukubensis TaxID=83656 RepID=A0A1V4ABQ0_9ACTN|nr:protoporphyrinogen oxidase [Streptomyces tsukubensis]OON80701.1 protoporphyrinogen oxidase [Streptomyces tsukubensis]QFR96243.1 protoporphyrinogen oxidase [Streptomyces tsukubensis]